jgi:nucleoid DNA-binding protein
MTRARLIAELAASHAHLRQADVELIVASVFDQIPRAPVRGARIELRGFGAFRELRARVNRTVRAASDRRTKGSCAGRSAAFGMFLGKAPALRCRFANAQPRSDMVRCSTTMKRLANSTGGVGRPEVGSVYPRSGLRWILLRGEVYQAAHLVWFCATDPGRPRGASSTPSRSANLGPVIN